MAGTAQPAPKRLRRDVRARPREDSAAERSARRVVYHSDGRYISATGNNEDSPEDGIAQPAPKRLRRDARGRRREDSAAERTARSVVYHDDGLLVRDADGHYLSATGNNGDSPEDGATQPAPKRLRRDARGRRREDSAAERSGRRVFHRGDGFFVSDANGRYVPDTAGERGQEEPPEAEVTTRARLTGGAGYSVIRRRPGESIEGIFRVGDIEWTVREQHPVTGVQAPRAEEHESYKAEASSTVIIDPMPATAVLPSPTPPLMIRVGDSVRHGVVPEDRAAAGLLGAAVDIFLVQPRPNGIPPSILQTVRGAGLRYWIEEAGRWVAASLGRPPVLPGWWSWASIMGQPAYGRGGICSLSAMATCVRAQHCLQFERRYGAGSFPYELKDAHGLPYLRDACQAAGVWAPSKPGSKPKGVEMRNLVKMMMDENIWVRTQDVPGWRTCVLRIRRYREFTVLPDDTDARRFIATVIRLQGPIIGALYSGPNYLRTYNEENYVYEGEEGVADHAVVCMEYAHTPRGLYLRVMDNLTSFGPMGWIAFEAFRYFFHMEVDALDRAELQLQRNNPGVAQSLLGKLLSFLRRR